MTIGVIFYKSSQTSKNGNTYTIWKMSDLQGTAGDLKTISVLLFGKAHAKHYPMPLNKVVGVLNPKVLEDRAGKGDVSIRYLTHSTNSYDWNLPDCSFEPGT